jgi:hypothetical protein
MKTTASEVRRFQAAARRIEKSIEAFLLTDGSWAAEKPIAAATDRLADIAAQGEIRGEDELYARCLAEVTRLRDARRAAREQAQAAHAAGLRAELAELNDRRAADEFWARLDSAGQRAAAIIAMG